MAADVADVYTASSFFVEGPAGGNLLEGATVELVLREDATATASVAVPDHAGIPGDIESGTFVGVFTMEQTAGGPAVRLRLQPGSFLNDRPWVAGVSGHLFWRDPDRGMYVSLVGSQISDQF